MGVESEYLQIVTAEQQVLNGLCYNKKLCWLANYESQSSQKSTVSFQMFRPDFQQAATENGALAAIGTGTQTKQGIVTEPFTP